MKKHILNIRDIYRPNWLKNTERDKKKLWLDKNENSDLILNKTIRSILKKIDPKAIFSYPDLSYLYKYLSKKLKISPENLLLTAGSDGGIKSVFETFIKPGDVVLRTNPTFAMYQVYSKIFKVKEILIEYRYFKSGPKFDYTKILYLIKNKKPRLICLPNPDSPTGHIISKKNLAKILLVSKKTNSLVLIDEAYYLFSKETAISYIKKYNNLILVRSAGKAFGMAGLRIGYVISNKKFIKEMHKLKPMYEINNLGAKIFYEMLKPNNFNKIKKSAKHQLEAKKNFKLQLRKLNFEVLENKGNFLHVNFGKHRKKITKEVGKIVYFRKKENHPCLKNFSRFTITNKKNFNKIIGIIIQCLKNKG